MGTYSRTSETTSPYGLTIRANFGMTFLDTTGAGDERFGSKQVLGSRVPTIGLEGLAKKL